MKKLEKINKNWKTITAFIAIIVSIFTMGYKVSIAYNKLQDTNNLTLQMALKSIIWNENIPDVERESACDTYLSHGWNSYTKKECQLILEHSEKFREE